VTWLIYMCDMTRSFGWQGSYTALHMQDVASCVVRECIIAPAAQAQWQCRCDITHSYVWHDSFICVTWLIYMFDMTHLHAWHDSFTCVTWLIHMCDMTHSYVWQNSFICVTRLTDVCVMTHSYVWHDSSTILKWLVPIYHYIPQLMHICDMTHPYANPQHNHGSKNARNMTRSYMGHDSFICVPWLTHLWNMTHPYATLQHKLGGSATATWLTHTCDTPRQKSTVQKIWVPPLRVDFTQNEFFTKCLSKRDLPKLFCCETLCALPFGREVAHLIYIHAHTHTQNLQGKLGSSTRNRGML